MQKSNPNHPKLESFKRREEEFMYLQQFKSKFNKSITKSHRTSRKSVENIYHNFNQDENKLLDELIIKCFPETYIAYIQKAAQEARDRSVSEILQKSANEVNGAKNESDRRSTLN